MEERSGRLERYLDPEFFEERGNEALSDRMDREIPEFDPEDPFDVLPEGLKVMLQEEDWQVVLYDEGIGEKGAGQKEFFKKYQAAVENCIIRNLAGRT